MRLLDRYLLKEFLKWLGACLVCFAIAWLAFDLFGKLNELQEHKVRGLDILKYELFRLPELLAIVLPVSLLLALLRVLTLHARHHELTAMRAAGISLWRICLPYFAVGLLASAVLFVINEFVAPYGAELADRILNARPSVKSGRTDLFEKIVYADELNATVWQADYNAFAGEMRDVHVRWRKPDGSLFVLDAGGAKYTAPTWTFSRVQAETQLPGAGNIFLTNRIFTNTLVVPEFTVTPQQINSDRDINRLANKAHVERTALPLTSLLKYQRTHLRLAGREKFWLETQIFSRLATPLTCFVVVLIAIPFGAAGGRRNVLFGVAGSLVICFTYFILQEFGLALGANGHIPPWLGAWLPDLFFTVLGTILIFRVR